MRRADAADSIIGALPRLESRPPKAHTDARGYPKIMYATRRDARRAGRVLRDREEYVCGTCSGWHLGTRRVVSAP